MRRAICWIRRDLRLSDHAALAEATARAERVAVLFIFDTVILNQLEDKADRRLTFIHRSLEEVDERLRSLGSRLVVGYGDPVELVPTFADRLQAQAVFAARDFESYAIRRDAEVDRRLRDHGRKLELVKDQVIFEGREVVGANGEPHRVYTPFMKAWMARLRPEDYAPREPDMRRLWPAGELAVDGLDRWPLDAMNFVPAPLWLAPGESGGRARLYAFAGAIDRYHERRDFLSPNETSGLSVHLRFGTVSIREAVRFARERPGEGPHKWLLELVWREFYQMILANFPAVEREEFNPIYRGREWPGRAEDLAAWREGRTGYPIVDAGMRCLNETGWMHNRMRMIVASFLTKDLLVDWRRGESWFARQLLDFDLASNNGGWQWAASTGVDPQPYFRIFNPISQARKFDPNAEFIREWVPELAALGVGAIWPHDVGPFELEAAGVRLGETYPRPIVDHAQARERAIAFLSRK